MTIVAGDCQALVLEQWHQASGHSVKALGINMVTQVVYRWLEETHT